MLPLENYINDGTNLLLPSDITDIKEYWSVSWRNRYLFHRVGAPSRFILNKVANDKRFFDDNGTLIDIESITSFTVVEYNVFGCQHRLDGPALFYNSGGAFWFMYDHELTEKEFLQIQHNSTLSGAPLWAELLVTKKFLEKKDIDETLKNIPHLFEMYPIKWVVTLLGINNMVETEFTRFYKIFEAEKANAST